MLHTRKSFAKLCNVQEQQIGVYIRRGKIIEKAKRIDDTLPLNKEFLDTRNEKIAGLEVKIATEPTDPKEIIERAKAYEHMNKLRTSKTEMDIEKAQEEIELFRLKKMKLQGKLIPTDIVEILIAQFAKGIYIATAQGVEEIIFGIGKKKSLSRRKISWEQLNVLWKH